MVIINIESINLINIDDDAAPQAPETSYNLRH
jgi:hypothetical protein